MEVVRRAVMVAVLLSIVGEIPAADVLRLVRDDGRDVATTSWALLRAPFHGTANDYHNAGRVILSLAAISLLDRSLRSPALDASGSWTDAVNDIGHAWGSPKPTAIATAGFYGLGLLANDSGLRRIGLEIGESFLLAGIGTQLLKYSLGRHRPFLDHGPYRFAGPTTEDRFQSCPSGDTETAFSLASVLTAESRSLPVGFVLYSLSAATMFQRLHRDRHWFSDTMTGAVIGTVVGWGVVRYHRQRSNTTRSLSISPTTHGAELSFNW
ncbi:MAG: phosphatase PAP2 family protein [Calditrichota bacterium]